MTWPNPLAPRTGEHLDHVAFPMGGLGAGMIALEGTGSLAQVSLRHRPDVYHEPQAFAALHVRGGATRVIEGPVPMRKAMSSVGRNAFDEPGNGLMGRNYGLPRFAEASFSARFPFANVALADATMPLTVELTGWSPFTPGQADDSSLPVAAIEYRVANPGGERVEAVCSFHAPNFMKQGQGACVGVMDGGFTLHQPALPDAPHAEGHFAAFVDDADAVVDAAWFRSGWFDALTVLWHRLAAGEHRAHGRYADGGPASSGASLYVPLTLEPGGERTIRLHLAWYVPRSDLRVDALADDTYVPWYAGRFANLAEVANYWREHYGRLRDASAAFRDCFFDSTLPPEVVEAVAANLSILKSPTCLRQADGRLWGWEGCHSTAGCCFGTCTHVWNYAQAIPHLFPELERTLRETKFHVSQDERGHQAFRTPLPIAAGEHKLPAAADGQLGGLIKLHREWRISGDTAWLATLWPAARASLEHCIAAWDPDRTGMLVEPHHNTYDIEFWGPDGMCTSIYAAALGAAVAMGNALDDDVTPYEQLLDKARHALATTLFNGQWFIQQVQWQGLHAGDPTAHVAAVNHTPYTPEALEILEREGPKHQYGHGCLADGVLGDWLARCAGLGPIVDADKTTSHLDAVFTHNFRRSLRDHANPQRPGYAFASEGGLLLCTWPQGHRPTVPFPYSDETWTGLEYQVAAHLAMIGRTDDALTIVRTARQRYDGRWRNPFDEYECGHWYARAMSSYSLLQAFGGARYDALEQVLYLDPPHPGDFRAFLCTATGYASVGVRDGEAFIDVKHGTIPARRVVHRPAEPAAYRA